MLLDRCPTLRNPERFKQMGIHTWTRAKYRHKTIWYAVKPKPIRIACFFHDEAHLVLTHGFIKKDRTWPAQEVERAKNIIEFFYDSHQDKELEHD